MPGIALPVWQLTCDLPVIVACELEFCAIWLFNRNIAGWASLICALC